VSRGTGFLQRGRQRSAGQLTRRSPPASFFGRSETYVRTRGAVCTCSNRGAARQLFRASSHHGREQSRVRRHPRCAPHALRREQRADGRGRLVVLGREQRLALARCRPLPVMGHRLSTRGGRRPSGRPAPPGRRARVPPFINVRGRCARCGRPQTDPDPLRSRLRRSARRPLPSQSACAGTGGSSAAASSAWLESEPLAHVRGRAPSGARTPQAPARPGREPRPRHRAGSRFLSPARAARLQPFDVLPVREHETARVSTQSLGVYPLKPV